MFERRRSSRLGAPRVERDSVNLFDVVARIKRFTNEKKHNRMPLCDVMNVDNGLRSNNEIRRK